MKTAVRTILCWPLFLGTLVALIVRALWGESMRWDAPVLVTTLSPTSWPMRSWYKRWGGTTLGGYGIMLAPGQAPGVLHHEEVHVEQLEAAAAGGFLLGLLVLIVMHSVWGVGAFFLCWVASGWLAYAGASIVALLRSEPNAYRGNHFEEAAYNATEAKCRKGEL